MAPSPYAATMVPGHPMPAPWASGPWASAGPGAMPHVPAMPAMPLAMHGAPAGVPYAVVAEQVRTSLDSALERRRGLLRDVDALTAGGYSQHLQTVFSATRKANLDNVDWRVPRLMYCKDPRYNEGVDPSIAFEVQQQKVIDGSALEQAFAAEAYADLVQRLEPAGLAPPLLERVVHPGPAFLEAVPNYQREDDIWNRRLGLRTLDEAMRGDVSKPMPRPAVFDKDYANCREGMYMKNDCPIT